mmetsp:Transcript_9147/g.31537  ORF Transcript_9147/g.31537 Transcript_9147/m.31537 type:complete len:216 (-) Transcript_9147:360-1007(-)
MQVVRASTSEDGRNLRLVRSRRMLCLSGSLERESASSSRPPLSSRTLRRPAQASAPRPERARLAPTLPPPRGGLKKESHASALEVCESSVFALTHTRSSLARSLFSKASLALSAEDPRRWHAAAFDRTTCRSLAITRSKRHRKFVSTSGAKPGAVEAPAEEPLRSFPSPSCRSSTSIAADPAATGPPCLGQLPSRLHDSSSPQSQHPPCSLTYKE